MTVASDIRHALRLLLRHPLRAADALQLGAAAWAAAFPARAAEDWTDEWVADPEGSVSIIDLAGGDQPLGNEDGRIQVVQNGEIYNHAELRAELKAQGHRFVSDVDTEVLEARPIARVTEALAGATPGLTVIQRSSQPGEQSIQFVQAQRELRQLGRNAGFHSLGFT